MLKVTGDKKPEVRYKGRYIEIKTKNKEKAKGLLSRLSNDLRNIMLSLLIYLHKMSTRWRSCTKNRTIILNPELTKAHKACIEYMIVFELCHLVHHNHLRKFMNLQTKKMPDWEKWKSKLEKVLA